MTDINLEHFRVKEAPATVYYIPNFISKEEETFLTDQVYSAPKPKWKQLSHRRLQNWGGLPHPKGMIVEHLPKWLDVYSHQIADLGVFGDLLPNHVLVNEYQPGQGIMPHEDGPLFHPVVTTVSLGSHALLDFYQHRRDSTSDEETRQWSPQDTNLPSDERSRKHEISLLLAPRSLFILKDDMYTSYLHGIAERTNDTLDERTVNLERTDHALGDDLARTRRISLTIRHVPKTLKVNLFGKKR